MMMKTLLFLSLISFAHVASAGVWVLSTRYENVDATSKNKKSVLLFTNRGGGSRTFSPPGPPWGMFDSKEIVLGGKNYFITFWADGARTVFYRVFHPDSADAPICEFISESESPELRLKNGKLQYQEVSFQQDQKKINVWKKCPPPQKTKAPASVPTKKSTKPAKKKPNPDPRI